MDNALKVEKFEEEFPVVIENGELNDIGDEKETYYAQRHQRELKESILSQNLPLQENFDVLVDRIKESFLRKGMFILQGETGSGKSIFTPIAVKQALLELGLINQTVVMQPRRDAARGVARATAAITDEKLGEGVGFSTSENKEQQWYTPIKVVTPGIFIKYLANGTLTKKQVGCLIIDEAHESTVDRDLVLGLIKLMREKDDAPMIVLTSATLDKNKLQDYFGLDDRDYLNIEGRKYQVEKEFITAEEKITKGADDDGNIIEKEKKYLELAAQKVKQIHETEPPGDILVFLPGSFEINNLIDRLEPLENAEILPLHGGLKPEERDLALLGYEAGSKKRRVIIATNIAETSVTVPGIKYVVDSCRQRMVRFNPVNGTREVGTEFISKDQSQQRAGRAGRISEGKYFSLLTKEEQNKLEQHPQSEIKKVNFSHTYLRIKSFGLKVEEFPFIDPPDPEMIHHARAELQILGALDENNKITEIGQEMMDLSMYFEPRIARMIIEARKYNCVPQALLMAAFERESSVFMPPSKEDDKTYGSRINANVHYQNERKKLYNGNSDFIRSLRVFGEALKHCLLESKHWDKSPEGLAKYQEYNDWCDQYRINPKGLKHIAFGMRRYLSFVGQPDYDLNELNNLADESNLSKVIYSAYPDWLLFEVNHKGDYISVSSDKTESCKISPGSAAFGYNNPKICVGKIEKGRERSYAQNIHPLNVETIYQVNPQLFDITFAGKENFELVDGHYKATKEIKVALKSDDDIFGSVTIDLDYPEAEIKKIIDEREANFFKEHEEQRRSMERAQIERLNVIESRYNQRKQEMTHLSLDNQAFFEAISKEAEEMDKVIYQDKNFERASRYLEEMDSDILMIESLEKKYPKQFGLLRDMTIHLFSYLKPIFENEIVLKLKYSLNNELLEVTMRWAVIREQIRYLRNYLSDMEGEMKNIRSRINRLEDFLVKIMERISRQQGNVLEKIDNVAINFLEEYNRKQAKKQAEKATKRSETKKAGLTPEEQAEKIRNKLLNDLTWAEFLLKDAKSHKVLSDPQIKSDKEIKQLVERAKSKDILGRLKECKELSQDQKNDVRLSGIAANLLSTAEKISGEIERLSGRNQKWFEVYLLILETIIPELEAEWGEFASEDIEKNKMRFMELAKDPEIKREEVADRILDILTNP